jgi:ABC-type antimicrobial peptide transport system permease subunit
MYVSSRQIADGDLMGWAPKDLVVKSSVSLMSLAPAVRAIIARADPQLPVSDVRMLADIVGGETASRRVQVRVLGTFAAIAFLLAGIGLHGLLAYNVSQGAREIGIRMALGAERHTILALVMRRGLGLALTGVIAGAALAVAVGRLLQSLLAGISSTDLVAFGAAVGLALVITTIASLVPALRAARVDPLQVMRAE